MAVSKRKSLYFVASKVWNIRTSHSQNYKMVHVNSKMSADEFITKVAKIFNLKKNLIIVTYEFRPEVGEDLIKVEIEPSDESSLLHAIEVLKNYSKLTVEVKVKDSSELSIAEGKRKCRTKETVSELLKREMGLHNDEGQRKRGYLDAKWSDKCDNLMAEDSRLLLEFDKLKAGVQLALGDEGFVINPFQMICPICSNILVLSSMNQPRSLVHHLREKHRSASAADDIAKRLTAWMENNFITPEQLNDKALLPTGLISPVSTLSIPRVRSAVLARDIH